MIMSIVISIKSDTIGFARGPLCRIWQFVYISIMYSPSDILAIIESRMEELGINQSQLGRKAFGRADNNAIQGLKKGSSPGFDRVAAMASALGLELYLGLPRPKAAGFSEEGEALSGEPPSAQKVRDYLPIPWHAPYAGSGSSPVSFSLAWMTANGLLPDDLVAVLVDDADVADIPIGKVLAVIDTRASRKSGYGLWCCREGGKTRLTRLLFDHDHIVVMQRKSTRPPRLLPASAISSLRPLGCVKWLGLLPDISHNQPPWSTP